MKKLYVISAFILISLNLFSQNSPSFYNEVNLSINRTTLYGFGPNNRFGFGIGYHRLYKKDKAIKPTFGIEYNQLNYFSELGNYGHMFNESDIYVNINHFSIPVGIRLQEKKLFFEAGGFIDLVLCSRKKGMLTEYSIREDGIPATDTKPFVSKGYFGNMYGLYCSIGYIIPMFKSEALIKAEFKSGLNQIDINGYSRISYLRLIFGFKI